MIKLHHHRATDDYHAKLVIIIIAAIRCKLHTDSNDLDDNTDIDVNLGHNAVLPISPPTSLGRTSGAASEPLSASSSPLQATKSIIHMCINFLRY